MLCGDWMEEEEEIMGIPISLPANAWPQGMMAYPDQTPAIPDHQQPPPPPAVQLKCPRCDSSNTKFCYYNNYSLSQPRHFCKACKRYWTRGGTLRNVPVGGGCRKNKRVKKPSSNASASVVLNQLSARMPPLSTTIAAGANTDISSLFYGLPSEFGGLNCHSGISTYNFQPQLNPLDCGIGFSPLSDHHLQMQAGMQGYPFFGSSLPTTAAASLLVSSLRQQQQQQQQYEDLQVSDGMRMVKRAKIEDEGHDIVVMNNGQIDQWQMPSDQISFESFSATGSAAADNSSIFYWNQAPAWPESTNCSPLI